MKSALNLLIFLAIGGGIYFGYKWLKSSDSDALSGGDSAGKTYVVIVGVADYSPRTNSLGTRDLSYSDDDAHMVYNFFQSPEGGSVPEANMSLLIDNQASRANIVSEMRRLFSKSTVEDRIIFYFSGHGASGTFCPYDYERSNNMTNLTKAAVAEIFRECHARTRLLFGDACHAGSMLKNASASSERGAPNSVAKDEQAGFAGFMAAHSDQYSLENPDILHGFFTKFFVEGAKGKADADNNKEVTVNELYQFVRAQLITATDGKQVPVLLGKFSENMVFSHL